MSSCSLAQFNLSLVCLFFGASLSLPHSLSSLPSLSHILLLFVCKIMKASPAKPLTRKTLSNLISIISKEQPPVPSTPSSPKYLKITTYSFSLSLYSSLCNVLSVSLCLLLLLSKHSGDSERLFCSPFVSLKCALATWLQLFILLAEIY